MLNINKIRQDFPMLNNKTMQGHTLVYFDSAATSLKPRCVIEAMNDYYFNYNSNVHRGDYDLAAKADQNYEQTRKTVAKFINSEEREVVFTSGTTQSINLVAFGYALNNLKEHDEIILNEAEHASNILPWYEIANKLNLKITFAPLNEHGQVDVNKLRELISEKTKLISIAYVSNVLGSVNDVKEIIKIAHENNVVVVVDAAQAIPHMKVDVKDLDCDFLAFSSHKMCGPTGIGVLYGKYDLLLKTSSTLLGGGMNAKFDNCQNMLLKKPPYKFEGGTPAIAEVIGFNAAINYLMDIGMDNIHEYEKQLKEYALKQLSKLDNVIIYNKDNDSGIITFNIKDVFCQDAGTYFNSKGIALRSGHHCAKLLPNHLNVVGTVRASLYFYNTKEEIYVFVEACKNGGDFLDAFFK
jgi:cysteine desulfurase/selenocysteine lyase